MRNIDKLIGIPFVDRGRSLDGCDCMGLAILAHKEFGIHIPDYNICSDDGEGIHNIFSHAKEGFGWEEIDEPAVPCLAVMGLAPGMNEMASHVGTYIGEDRIIHTLRDQGSTVIKTTHPFFRSKILGFYRWCL